jgi:hypothetical protein
MAERARRWPLVTLGLALVIAGGLFVVQARRPTLYSAEVGLLITEGAFAADGRPRPRGELRAFVTRTILGMDNLEALIREHRLVSRLGESSESATIDRMRQSIEVYTWHDDFEGYRQTVDPPRSARVTIGFSAPDPQLAVAVASALGTLVAETQTAREADVIAARVETLRMVAEGESIRAAGLRAQLDQARRESLEQPTSASKVREEDLERASQAAETRWKSAATELVEAQLQAHAGRQAGSLVQVIDQGVPFWRNLPRRQRQARQAAISIITGLFLAVVLVGAFDPRIRDERDVLRMGLRPLGSVPAYGNSHSGAEV